MGAQLEEEKKACLSLRIKPLDLECLETEQLRTKANELWETVIRLETEKYDLEERGKRQGHDLKVLNERQIQRLRLKAVRMGCTQRRSRENIRPKSECIQTL